MTHQDLDYARLSALGMDAEEVATDDTVALSDLMTLAEDQGKPVSHFLAAIPLSTELRLRDTAPVTVKVCAGSCQKWGALDLLEHLAARADKRHDVAIVPVSCLDRCDQAAACEVSGPGGKLVIEAATAAKLDEAIEALTSPN